MTESPLPPESIDEPLPKKDANCQIPEDLNGWRAFATLSEFLHDDGWHPQQLDDKNVFRVYFSGDHGDVRCYAQIRVETLDKTDQQVVQEIMECLHLEEATQED